MIEFLYKGHRQVTRYNKANLGSMNIRKPFNVPREDLEFVCKQLKPVKTIGKRPQICPGFFIAVREATVCR